MLLELELSVGALVDGDDGAFTVDTCVGALVNGDDGAFVDTCLGALVGVGIGVDVDDGVSLDSNAFPAPPVEA